MLTRNNFILEKTTDPSHQNSLYYIIGILSFIIYTHLHPQHTKPTQYICFIFPEVQVTGTLRTQKDLQNSVGQVSSDCSWQSLHITRRFPNLAGQQSHGQSSRPTLDLLNQKFCQWGLGLYFLRLSEAHGTGRSPQRLWMWSGQVHQQAGRRRESMEWSLETGG